MGELVIPEHLAVHPFYEEDTELKNSDRKAGVPFIDEILWFNNELKLAPWQHPLIFIPVLFEEWEKDAAFLEECFSKKDRHRARPVMLYQTANLISAVSWMNRSNVSKAAGNELIECLQSMNKTPANIGDRLSFIIGRPDHHHSFMQLRSLFIETKKQFMLVKIEEKS